MAVTAIAAVLFVNACVLGVVYLALLAFMCKIVRSDKFKQKLKIDDAPPVSRLYQFFGWLFR